MFSSQNSQVSNNVNYIEDVFSTYLYTGNGSTQTITNGIDLAGKGGLTWIKSRTNTSGGETSHVLVDTVRGSSKWLASEATSSETTNVNLVTGFTTSGFSVGNAPYWGNENAIPYASWTFREQPKFFDVVTYTGTGVAGLTVPHNLGSEPGCIIVKNITDGSADWAVYHRSIGNTGGLTLNNTNATTTGSAYWNNTSPTSTQFTLGSFTRTNVAGQSFVAYLFAHNAGGFGLTGTDNVISCGTFTTDGTGAAGNITLGYEAQWLLIKRSDGVGSWNIIDVMRGSSLTSYNYLQPNASTQESSSTSAGQGIFPTATGFFVGTNFPAASATYIYVAIRRGPMKVPTLGTTVFLPTAFSGNGGSGSYVNGFPTDLIIHSTRNTAGLDHFVYDRLRGRSPQLKTNTTDAESGAAFYNFDKQNSVTYAGNNTGYNALGETYIDWNFRRAPGFFDEVCYTGTGSATTQAHNLTVTPEFLIVKRRSTAADEWTVRAAGTTGELYLNRTNAQDSSFFYLGAPTNTTFSLLSGGAQINAASNTYVAYLFATAAGVSKVGSYTGTGALQTVACGFTSGARFVLIKRTDSTGDWYVWDSARGITSGNDPYLLINSTAAEVTSTNYVDTDTTGFKVTAAAPAALNASGGTYIFLAVA